MLKSTKLITTKTFKLATYAKGSVKAEKLALVLPGRLDTKDYPHMRSHVDFLSTKGYFALSFDSPGTWESEGDITLYTMSNTIKAVNEIIEYFGNKPTFVMGHSRGGSIAMLAGIKNKYVERFAAVMSSASYKNYEKPVNKSWNKIWKETGFHISTRDTPKEYSERTKKFRLPYNYVKDSLQYDMLDDLKTCKKPKLFIAGKKDEFEDPIKVKEAYEISSEPKQFELLDTIHDYRKNEKMIQKVNQILGRFIQ